MKALPPLAALRAFEAAAGAGSFARAADQLCVTPAAISQQIRQLEQHLDSNLFVRSARGVHLTPAGEGYLTFVRAAFEQLRLGQQQLACQQRPDSITIATYPSVASKWLMPRVLQWMERHPEQEIRVEASHARVDFGRGDIDLCIAFGDQDYPELEQRLLFTDSVSAVASPALLDTLDNPHDLQQLLQLPMIHIDWGSDNRYLPGWQQWLTAAGQGQQPPTPGPRFNLSSMAIEAAVQGKGLLLGQQLLIETELTSGQLIKVSDISLTLEKSYFLVYPRQALDCSLLKGIVERISVKR
ncbi:LysR substrate-binding domain-containing protein [Marinobacterium jannaschii]|uniref:LysR substrate-binding domain-containing protein n=1 Tax=Marinobacterium jannaschii TaxID=64970 RepID=UPI00055D21D7|nr:LysR substrate-binding domain-containing protein [Marinobacterium jannaschii]